MTVPAGAAKPAFTEQFIDLAQPRLGAEVLFASDDFFAPKERLIHPAAPVFYPGRYDDHGKWMDGWESRRKRTAGHDFCVLRLCPGVIEGIEIDTSFFTGNYPPHASLEGCLPGQHEEHHRDWQEQVDWQVVLPKTPLQGNAVQFFRVADKRTWSHLRFHNYPDGGVARLRVYGVAHWDWSALAQGEWADLAAMRHGGRALACNDMHFGRMSNLIAPGHGVNMGDGWETRRRREPGNDWVMLELGHTGIIQRAEIDTTFFKGNYPARCALHGALLEPSQVATIDAMASYWQPLLPPVELGPDRLHLFESEITQHPLVSHVRFDIYPDGGVSRLRLFGEPVRA